MRCLYIIGAGGQGREVASVARDLEADGRLDGTLAGFLDQDLALHGRVIEGLTVFAPPPPAQAGADGPALLLGVGYPELKARVLEEFGKARGEWPVLVHPAAAIAGSARVARGTLIQAGAVVTTGVDVGEFVTVNVGATVSHDCVLGRLSTVSPGASLAGNVVVGEGAFIGIGAAVIQGVRIGAWSVVGAGAAVVEDVPANAIVAGVPARVIGVRADGCQHG